MNVVRMNGIRAHAAIVVLTGILVFVMACGGGENDDRQATTDAAVAGTIANQPTTTPDIQATVDAAIAGTASANPATATFTPTEVTRPEKRGAEFYETRLRSLLSEEDIPNVLYGHEISDVSFSDLGEMLGFPLPSNQVAFTGLTFQGITTAIFLQVTDFDTSMDAIGDFEIADRAGQYDELISINGKQGARVSSAGVAAILFVTDGSLISIVFTGSAAGPPEWEALELLATTVEQRFQ